MLDPEYLAQLPEPILRLWRKAEQQILADMARRISTYDYWIPAADHQSARLRAAGHTQEEILAALAPVTRKSEAELRQMMTDAGSRCLADDAELYHAAGLDVPDPAKHSGLTATLNTGYRQTAQTMENLTRTTAQTATQQFENALDRAWLQINSGAFDYDAAIRGAIKDLSEAGVSAIRYPSGREDSIETAIRRAVLTGVNQTAGKLQMELADEVGCDLVEVTAHAGARPSHALWQGKIYSRSGKSKKYPDFVSSTGYGTGAGLCGWNCRHSFGPYVEGAPRVWTDEKLAELNEPKYEYNGEKLTEYEAQQKENYFTRQIQRWNREAEAMRAAGQDPSEAMAKAREWDNNRKDFLINREQLSTDELSLKNGTDANKTAFSPAKTIEEAKEYAEKTLLLPQTTAYSIGLNLDVANGINEAIGRVNDAFGNLSQAGYLENILVYTKKKDAYAAYDPRLRVLLVNKEATHKNALVKMAKTAQGNYDIGYWSSSNSFHSIYHELGHAVQHKFLDNDEQKRNAIQALYSQVYSDILGTDAEYLSVDDQKIFDECKKAKNAGFSYYGLQDIGEFTAESIAQYFSGDSGKIATKVFKALIGG